MSNPSPMDEEPLTVVELLEFVLFLGAFTYTLGAAFQAYVLWRNRRSFFTGVVVILLTRILTVAASLLIWSQWFESVDIMFLFLFLPAVVPEIVFSLVVLRLFGNKISA